jgi:ABC transporter substrate binding protein (PQQ-dependent alcohol dehydrogenase system)
MRVLAAILVWVALAAQAHAAEQVRLGYLALADDPRFDPRFAYARVPSRPQGDTLAAVQMAIADMKILTDARKLEVVLDASRVPAADLEAEAKRMAAEGVSHIVLDLPAAQVASVAETLQQPTTLLNATAPEDWLRDRCYPHLLHTAASDRMIADALVQHMVRQKWQSVLVLQGKTESDLVRAAAFTEAAERFRLEIVDTRSFDLSTNPEMREENNVMLLTGGAGDYDAVFIADEIGEYARYLPFRTALPRPVVGAAGLVPLEWHWALERYGAPQVNSRFEQASERRMGWQDWSVWAAARAVLTAFAKTRDATPEKVDAFLRSDRLRLDGSKGTPMSFRPWSGQLRMPILLTTQNAVIEIAPLEGFLHHENTLDSLGQDEPEFACE